MPASPQCLFDFLQLCPQPLLHRLPYPHKSVLRCLATAMREAQKVEGCRFALPPPGSVQDGKPPQL
jgi:hypothetical protein